MSRADSALDVIAGLALAGAAAAVMVRPRHVSAIAHSPLVPAAARLTGGAAHGLMRRLAPTRRARGKRKLARLITRYGPSQAVTQTAGRRLNGGAAMLAFSVLADSAVEHYRGSFQNRAMYTPLVVATLTLGASLFGTADKRAARHSARDSDLRRRGRNRPRRPRLSRLQHHQAARRLVMAQSFLCRADWSADGSGAGRSARTRRRARARYVAMGTSVIIGSSGRPHAGAASARSDLRARLAKPGCCISAAPSTIPSWSLPVTTPAGRGALSLGGCRLSRS